MTNPYGDYLFADGLIDHLMHLYEQYKEQERLFESAMEYRNIVDTEYSLEAMDLIRDEIIDVLRGVHDGRIE